MLHPPSQHGAFQHFRSSEDDQRHREERMHLTRESMRL
jgi:hypothetical protein